jgi:hypothetical protein
MDKLRIMDAIQHLKTLGKELLYIESVYLNLKIEKALSGKDFVKDKLLNDAETLWQEANKEYFKFLGLLKKSRGLTN